MAFIKKRVKYKTVIIVVMKYVAEVVQQQTPTLICYIMCKKLNCHLWRLSNKLRYFCLFIYLVFLYSMICKRSFAETTMPVLVTANNNCVIY